MFNLKKNLKMFSKKLSLNIIFLYIKNTMVFVSVIIFFIMILFLLFFISIIFLVSVYYVLIWFFWIEIIVDDIIESFHIICRFTPFYFKRCYRAQVLHGEDRTPGRPPFFIRYQQYEGDTHDSVHSHAYF